MCFFATEVLVYQFNFLDYYEIAFGTFMTAWGAFLSFKDGIGKREYNRGFTSPETVSMDVKTNVS